MAILVGGTVAGLLVLLFTTVKTCHSRCRCEEQSFGLFDSFSLTRVDCSGLGPKTIPVSIPLGTSSLDLSSNGIHSIESAVLSGPGYTTLSSLDLNSNLISVMNGNAFSKLHYLETLDLSWNSIQKLVEGFSGFYLAEVDLSHNRIHEIDLNVFRVHEHGRPLSVDLSYNLITSVIGSKLSRPLNIQRLHLAGNELTSVPRLQDVCLRFLTLNDNPVSVVDEQSFAGLRDLVHLSLGSMPELHTIKPLRFQDLQNLQVLDLSDNKKLKTLRAEVFHGLASLQELNLSKSWVTSLPTNILQLLPSINSIALRDGVNCRRQERFHRRSKADAALTCDGPSVA